MGQLMPPAPPYTPSASQPLFIMAMDHRASFAQSLFGVTGDPTAAELHRMQDAKMVIYEGAQQVASGGIPLGRIGVLTDEMLGSAVAKAAKSDGLILAMPIERSGMPLFELDYGDQFAQHVELFDPEFFKVLVRYNPADEARDRNTQIERLVRVSDWAKSVGRQWLFELLVPPTREQLSIWEDQDHFDHYARPTLTVETLAQLQTGGVHPTIWKLEGYETAEGAHSVLRSVAEGTDHPAECIVLGRNAPLSRVEHWLEVAAPLPGYAGFAVGRSIWEQPLKDLLAGHIERPAAVALIAQHYATLIETYIRARTPGSSRRPRPEAFTLQNPRLTPDREETIREALAGADIRDTELPAWMAATLLAEVEALRSESPKSDS